MTTLVNRDHGSLVSDLMSWLGAETQESQIKLEEYVQGDRYVIRADIPGVDPEKDIEVVVDGNVLRLHGERREEKHARRRTEIRYGAFERALTLPRDTKPEEVEADYVDGVLTVSVPTSGVTEPQVIQVKHGEPQVE